MIGFHLGPGGNASGIGTMWHRLDEAGIPFFVKSVDDYGKLAAAIQIRKTGGRPHTLVYRLSTVGQGDGYDYDVPNYDLDPMVAANRHWTATKAKLPADFDKQNVWLEVINEVDKDRSDWLGRFAVAISNLANGEGYAVALFGWSSGEPEPSHWETPGMVEFLRLAAGRPDMAAVSLHEYSYEPDDLEAGHPWQVGRFRFLFDACGRQGIRRPTVLITEFGWTHEEVPEPEVAIPQLEWAWELYAPYGEIRGAAVWYLGGQFAGIANQAQKLIAPLTDLLLRKGIPDPNPNPIPVPPPSGYFHTRLIKPANIRRDPSTNSPAITPQPAREGLELVKVGNVIGQPVGGENRWFKTAAFLSRSYVTDTTPGKVRTNRPVNLRTVPTTYNNTPIVTIPAGVEFESLGNVKDENNNGLWSAVALYVWLPLAIDAEPGIRLASPLRIPLRITSPFNAPRDYVGEHEGVDFYAPLSTPVYAPAAGLVDGIRANDPGSGYGKYVRLKHSGRYLTWFGHLSRIDVAVGQAVSAGQQIGLSGNSGGSSGPHLHVTLQDIPQGLDSYIVDDVCNPELYFHPAVSLPNTTPPVPEPGRTYDLLDYMRGDGRQYELQYTWGGGGTHPVQTQASGNIFYNVKGGGEYEECYYDDKYIYRGIDTSEAPDRYYTQNTGNIYGAMWAKRRMAVGETVTKSPLVIHYYKDGCQERLRGQPTDRLTLVRHYDSYRFDSGLTLSDVLYLEWNQGEGYFYARSFGLVGFVFSGGKSYISEIHQGRPNLPRNEIPCFRPTSRYYVP